MEIKIEPLSKPVIDLQATGEKIKQLRILKGLSVHDLQILLDFEYPQAIYLWEAGKTFPTIENLMLLSQIFKVDILEIVVRKQV
ncbi:MAG: helix-turn-helix transcriptional regulator [Treponema sp.]|nr:helix-turn-helix transcriptional regulator [Treponema sp.]